MLAVEGITLRYGERTVLEGVSLTVERGEVVALIGPNGAGKSTLIRAASGILEPAAGRVTLDGADVTRMRPLDRARRVAVVPQGAPFPELFTVLETVLVGRTPHLGWLARESPADLAAAREAMERTGTADLAARRLGELSGGERQLVLVARALAQAAPCLLLDEPTANLDLRHESRILGLVRRLAIEDRLAVLVALHDLNLAARHAGRVALLAGGAMRACGAPRDVLTAERLGAAYGVGVRTFPHPATGDPIVFPAE